MHDWVHWVKWRIKIILNESQTYVDEVDRHTHCIYIITYYTWIIFKYATKCHELHLWVQQRTFLILELDQQPDGGYSITTAFLQMKLNSDTCCLCHELTWVSYIWRKLCANVFIVISIHITMGDSDWQSFGFFGQNYGVKSLILW